MDEELEDNSFNKRVFNEDMTVTWEPRTAVAYLPGRMAGMNPNSSNKNPLYHIISSNIENGSMVGKAICGIKPGRRSYGWYPVDEKATCPKCLQHAPVSARSEPITKDGFKVEEKQIWEDLDVKNGGRRMRVQRVWLGQNEYGFSWYVDVRPEELYSPVTGKYQRCSQLRVDSMHEEGKKGWKLTKT
jgi:hypothetical protein